MKPSIRNVTLMKEAAVPSEVAQLTLSDCGCRVLCVDDVVPHHCKSRHGSRPRLLGGHMYALVADSDRTGIGHAAPDAHCDLRELLTNRELQIVQLISMGSPTKCVADALGISEFTVRSYLKNVYCKLGVRSRGALVYRYAQAFRSAGLVSAPAQ